MQVTNPDSTGPRKSARCPANAMPVKAQRSNGWKCHGKQRKLPPLGHAESERRPQLGAPPHLMQPSDSACSSPCCSLDPGAAAAAACSTSAEVA